MGTDKAVLRVDGVMLAERVARVLERAGCDPVVFVGGDAARLAGGGRRHVADLVPGAGPAGGVLTALRAFPGVATGRVLVAACDLVSLTEEAVQTVLDDVAACAPEAPARVVIAHSGRLEPMLACWPVSAAPTIESLLAGTTPSLRALASAVGMHTVAVPEPPLHNANRPADLPDGSGGALDSGMSAG